jgi:ribosome-associated translation inhibitor RaiA
MAKTVDPGRSIPVTPAYREKIEEKASQLGLKEKHVFRLAIEQGIENLE